MTAVPIAEAIEGAIDHSGKSAIDVIGPKKMRGHHRRKSQRDNAGDENGTSERECELTKERAC